MRDTVTISIVTAMLKFCGCPTLHNQGGGRVLTIEKDGVEGGGVEEPETANERRLARVRLQALPATQPDDCRLEEPARSGKSVASARVGIVSQAAAGIEAPGDEEEDAKAAEEHPVDGGSRHAATTSHRSRQRKHE